MRRALLFALALGLLMGGALAEIETTGNVNLREGPGIGYDVAATVKEGTLLEELDCVIADERGVDWYWVSYLGRECWISSKYARVAEGSEGAANELLPEALTGDWTLERFQSEDFGDEGTASTMSFYAGEDGAWMVDYFYEYGGETTEIRGMTAGYHSQTPEGIRSEAPWYLEICVRDGAQTYISMIGQDALRVEHFYLLDGEGTVSTQIYRRNAEEKRFGMARLVEERAESNIIFISIEEYVWVRPEDAELIEKYELEDALDGYDYEIVSLDGTSRIYTAMKNGTHFKVLDPETGVLQVEADWQGFVQRLRELEDCGANVYFRASEEDGALLEIEEFYMP